MATGAAKLLLTERQCSGGYAVLKLWCTTGQSHVHSQRTAGSTQGTMVSSGYPVMTWLIHEDVADSYPTGATVEAAGRHRAKGDTQVKSDQYTESKQLLFNRGLTGWG